MENTKINIKQTKNMTNEKVLREYYKLPKRISKVYINAVLGSEGNTKKDLFNYLNSIFKSNVGSSPLNYYKKKQNATPSTMYVFDNSTKEIAKLNTKNPNPVLYQQFNINTDTKLKNNLKINNLVFTSTIPENQEMNLYINWNAELLWSGDVNDDANWFYRNDEYTATLSSSEIEKYTTELINALYNPSQIDKLNISVRSVLTEQKFELNKMQLKDHKPLDICNLYNEVIPNEGGRCIQKYMNKIYPKYSKKKMENLKTTEDIHEYCKTNNIKMIAYDIQGNIIMENKLEKKNKSRKSMIFIAYNNHLYPIKNKVLNKVRYDEKELKPVYTSSLSYCFKKIIKEGFMPSNLLMNGDKIISFIHKEELFHSNEDYDICKDILNKFGIGDMMNAYVNRKNIGEKIAELYVKGNISSFIPENNKFIKGGYNYNNRNVLCNENEEFITIDQNKCYSSILSNLDYLITCDVKKHRLRYIEDQDIEIIDHYLYVVEPKYSSQLLECNNIYEGKHIKFCREEGLEFTIREEMETEKVENYYKQMIIDLYNKVDNKIFKDIINVMIGKFESYSHKQINYRVSKIVDDVELDTIEDLPTIEICDGLHAVKEPVEKYNLYNKKPISIQIKDNARVKNYMMMKQLGLEYNNIKQVKTDSITFKHDVNKTKEYLKYIKDELGSWKLEEYAEQQGSPPRNTEISFVYEYGDSDNIFGDCYAGCGKSHKIINDILIDEEIKKDYIILTPSHATAKQYRKLKYNAQVIQLYSLTNKIPIQKNIIIDEIGMVDNQGWNVLYKCKLNDKRLIGYGDKNQLLPIGTDKHYFSKNWINYMFGSRDIMTTNYRNHFEKSYYDYLITCKDRTKLIDEIKKYNNKTYYDADIIIAYRNDTRNKYNKLMCDRLGINKKFDIGTKLICKTNDFKNIGLFNNLDCVVKSCDGVSVVLNDDEQDYKINIEHLKHFEYGYARTLHSVQGESLNSYYYPEEDLIPFFINNRTAYTLISRLKTK